MPKKNTFEIFKIMLVFKIYLASNDRNRMPEDQVCSSFMGKKADLESN
jgi:hypothetical protein